MRSLFGFDPSVVCSVPGRRLAWLDQAQVLHQVICPVMPRPCLAWLDNFKFKINYKIFTSQHRPGLVSIFPIIIIRTMFL